MLAMALGSDDIEVVCISTVAGNSIDVQAFRDILEGSLDRFIGMCRRGTC